MKAELTDHGHHACKARGSGTARANPASQGVESDGTMVSQCLEREREGAGE